jgi:chromosome segregation ATPase
LQYDDNAGWVKEIRLVDFMCHRNLSVKIGKNLNFLVGHNGSKYAPLDSPRCLGLHPGGKSAILTGLSIAMGGKATTTKRANGVKDFIRGQEAYVESVIPGMRSIAIR